MKFWAVVGAANPLRVYLLQDGWAHIVAKPYRVDQLLTNYRDRCAHLWSTSACSVTHAHRVLRANHDDFATGLVGVPRGAELHISYVDTALPRAERQRLLAHGTMSCACERCVDEEAAEGAAVPEERVSGVKRQRT